MDKSFSRQQIGAKIEGRVLCEGIADCEHEVGGNQSLARRGMAAVGEDAKPERMIFGNDSRRSSSVVAKGIGKRSTRAWSSGPAPLRTAPKPINAMTDL